MDAEEYFKNVQQHFDPFIDIKTSVLTAQAFVNLGILSEEDAIKEMKITKQLYDQYKELPKS